MAVEDRRPNESETIEIRINRDVKTDAEVDLEDKFARSKVIEITRGDMEEGKGFNEDDT